MSVKYQLKKSERNDNTKGKWYARAVYDDTIDLDELAERIQDRATAKKSDVLAVLTELVEVMNESLSDGKIVKLDGFGRFKIGIESEGTDKAEDWNPQKHVKDIHVNFQSEHERDTATGKFNRQFLTGIKLKEYNFYDEPEKDTGGE